MSLPTAVKVCKSLPGGMSPITTPAALRSVHSIESVENLKKSEEYSAHCTRKPSQASHPSILCLWPVLLHTSASLSIDNALARTGVHASSHTIQHKISKQLPQPKHA